MEPDADDLLNSPAAAGSPKRRKVSTEKGQEGTSTAVAGAPVTGGGAGVDHATASESTPESTPAGTSASAGSSAHPIDPKTGKPYSKRALKKMEHKKVKLQRKRDDRFKKHDGMASKATALIKLLKSDENIQNCCRVELGEEYRNLVRCTSEEIIGRGKKALVASGNLGAANGNANHGDSSSSTASSTLTDLPNFSDAKSIVSSVFLRPDKYHDKYASQEFSLLFQVYSLMRGSSSSTSTTITRPSALVDIGAGNANLAILAAIVLGIPRVICVEMETPRDELRGELFLPDKLKESISVERVESLIEDWEMDERLEDVVIVGKHLCGPGTDAAIEFIRMVSEKRPKAILGCVFATCCCNKIGEGSAPGFFSGLYNLEKRLVVPTKNVNEGLTAEMDLDLDSLICEEVGSVAGQANGGGGMIRSDSKNVSTMSNANIASSSSTVGSSENAAAAIPKFANVESSGTSSATQPTSHPNEMRKYENKPSPSTLNQDSNQRVGPKRRPYQDVEPQTTSAAKTTAVSGVNAPASSDPDPVESTNNPNASNPNSATSKAISPIIPNATHSLIREVARMTSWRNTAASWNSLITDEMLKQAEFLESWLQKIRKQKLERIFSGKKMFSGDGAGEASDGASGVAAPFPHVSEVLYCADDVHSQQNRCVIAGRWKRNEQSSSDKYHNVHESSSDKYHINDAVCADFLLLLMEEIRKKRGLLPIDLRPPGLVSTKFEYDGRGVQMADMVGGMEGKE